MVVARDCGFWNWNNQEWILGCEHGSRHPLCTRFWCEGVDWHCFANVDRGGYFRDDGLWQARKLEVRSTHVWPCHDRSRGRLAADV